jgi:hypothetical protein
LYENELENEVDRPDYGAEEEHEDDDLDRRVLELKAVGPGDLPHLVLHLVIELHHAAKKVFALDYFNGHYSYPRTERFQAALFGFLVQLVRVAAGAVLLPLDALGVQALVLVGKVVAIFTDFASKNDFFAGHCSVLMTSAVGTTLF